MKFSTPVRFVAPCQGGFFVLHHHWCTIQARRTKNIGCSHTTVFSNPDAAAFKGCFKNLLIYQWDLLFRTHELNVVGYLPQRLFYGVRFSVGRKSFSNSLFIFKPIFRCLGLITPKCLRPIHYYLNIKPDQARPQYTHFLTRQVPQIRVPAVFGEVLSPQSELETRANAYLLMSS